MPIVRPEKLISCGGLRQLNAVCIAMAAVTAYGTSAGRATRWQRELRRDDRSVNQAPGAIVTVGEVAHVAEPYEALSEISARARVILLTTDQGPTYDGRVNASSWGT